MNPPELEILAEIRYSYCTTFFFLDFFFFSGVVFVVLSIEAIEGVLVAGKLLPIFP